MKKILLSLFVAVVLALSAGCDQSATPTPRGEPLVKEHDRTNLPILVTVKVYPNHAEVTKAKIAHERERGVRHTGRVMGWAAWNATGTNQCHVHVVEPKTYNDSELETWGHELAHCVYGRWHK